MSDISRRYHLELMSPSSGSNTQYTVGGYMKGTIFRLTIGMRYNGKVQKSIPPNAVFYFLRGIEVSSHALVISYLTISIPNHYSRATVQYAIYTSMQQPRVSIAFEKYVRYPLVGSSLNDNVHLSPVQAYLFKRDQEEIMMKT